MPVALAEALTSSGKLGFLVFVIWRLFPDGLPGMVRAWAHYRVTSDARKLLRTPDANDRRIAVDILRAPYGVAGVPDTQMAQDVQDRPPNSPADPPP